MLCSLQLLGITVFIRILFFRLTSWKLRRKLALLRVVLRLRSSQSWSLSVGRRRGMNLFQHRLYEPILVLLNLQESKRVLPVIGMLAQAFKTMSELTSDSLCGTRFNFRSVGSYSYRAEASTRGQCPAIHCLTTWSSPYSWRTYHSLILLTLWFRRFGGALCVVPEGQSVITSPMASEHVIRWRHPGLLIRCLTHRATEQWRFSRSFNFHRHLIFKRRTCFFVIQKNNAMMSLMTLANTERVEFEIL